MGILDNIAYIPCNPANYGGKRKASDIKYLVYHYTGNDGDHDTNNAKYYRDNVVESSAHYFVDDDSITQSVPDLVIAWAVGGKRYKNYKETGGAKLYGIAKNANSISIEMCDTSRDGALMATEQTLSNAIELGKYLMQKYDIPIDRVIRHFEVSGKPCPAYFVDNEKWEAFKARLRVETDEKEEDMIRYQTISEISEFCPWATGTVEKLIDKGIIKGSGTFRDTQGRPADMNLTEDMLRMLVWNDRAGVYDGA